MFALPQRAPVTAFKARDEPRLTRQKGRGYYRGRPQAAALLGVLIGERVERRTRIRIVQPGRSDWHANRPKADATSRVTSGNNTARTATP